MPLLPLEQCPWSSEIQDISITGHNHGASSAGNGGPQFRGILDHWISSFKVLMLHWSLSNTQTYSLATLQWVCLGASCEWQLGSLGWSRLARISTLPEGEFRSFRNSCFFDLGWILICFSGRKQEFIKTVRFTNTWALETLITQTE